MKKKTSILFYSDKSAIIRPHNLVKKIDIAENCVITFFADELEKIIEKYPSRILEYFKFDSFKLPIYEVDYNRERITLMQAMVGAPAAARQVEDLIARGCNKFIVCGDCGVLDKNIIVGNVVLPLAAIRDEGTEFIAENSFDDIIQNNIQFTKTKTWTTDAFYRETKAKVIKRKNEGCLVVEMEASAYMAVAEFNNVKLGQVLYASDNLDSKVWNRRKDQVTIINREFLLNFAIQCCLKL